MASWDHKMAAWIIRDELKTKKADNVWYLKIVVDRNILKDVTNLMGGSTNTYKKFTNKTNSYIETIVMEQALIPINEFL